MSTPAVSATTARANLFNLIKEVAADHTVKRITSNAGDAVLMSAEDYESWQETVYLLRSPANARRLMEAVARDKAGESGINKTMEELESLTADAAGDE
ncbi:type II toxin-antitoxin system Phd/YefM family antitoxin [Streptomyces sp. ISL-100]|uniref:type II toxin-antitoxin system Phd/YefM family antitoxin n=1 Tax=Streptomyces sp. ISL-100 TaxID=2819173 RepID=UPI001BEBB14C|nr:type II toxin-antitoxin system prevent-host-death family antitoxin [Streptomyces sp. ISL-100]MBT2395638.1 type II toxin-antitoxin system prevent-host-death family antitoxin [Streptomyces sp. ISL-100]